MVSAGRLWERYSIPTAVFLCSATASVQLQTSPGSLGGVGALGIAWCRPPAPGRLLLSFTELLGARQSRCPLLWAVTVGKQGARGEWGQRRLASAPHDHRSAPPAPKGPSAAAISGVAGGDTTTGPGAPALLPSSCWEYCPSASLEIMMRERLRDGERERPRVGACSGAQMQRPPMGGWWAGVAPTLRT